MVGIPNPCWNCDNVDFFSTARRIFCEKCGANVWYKIYPQLRLRKFRKSEYVT